MNLTIDASHSGDFPVLMQSFVSAPRLPLQFLRLFAQRAVHTIAEQLGSGTALIEERGECVLLEDRWFRPALCGQGSVNDNGETRGTRS